ncbi:type II toxin-antitoxin system Phd/YefM family antitoxin [Spirochaeta dissipatitropha]
MKFITVRDFRTSPAKIWQELPGEHEMIITNNGKPIALLTPISDIDFEESIKTIRKVKAIQAVKKMQESSVKNNNSSMTNSDIDEEISNFRKSK